MNRNQAKRIEEIVDAITAVLAEKAKPKQKAGNPFEKLLADQIPHLVPDDVKKEFGNPVAVIRIYNTKPRPGNLNVAVTMEWCDSHIEPRHFSAVKRMIQAFADKKAAEQ